MQNNMLKHIIVTVMQNWLFKSVKSNSNTAIQLCIHQCTQVDTMCIICINGSCYHM